MTRTLSKLIESLEQIRNEHGDLPVWGAVCSHEPREGYAEVCAVVGASVSGLLHEDEFDVIFCDPQMAKEAAEEDLLLDEEGEPRESEPTISPVVVMVVDV